MMRWMLAVLVVINVSLFVWGQTVGKRGGVENHMPLENIGALEPQAVSRNAQVQRDESESAITTLSVQQTVAPVMICGEFEQLTEQAQATDLQAALEQQGSKVLVEERKQEVGAGYWALVPATTDTAAAKQIEKALKAAGIDEIWRFRKGNLKDAISLGMYDRKASAQNRVKKVTAKGFSAEVVPKMQSVTDYRLVFMGEHFDQAVKTIKNTISGAKINEISCEADFPF